MLKEKDEMMARLERLIEGNRLKYTNKQEYLCKQAQITKVLFAIKLDIGSNNPL